METPTYPPAAQPQQKSNTTKIVIIVVAVIAGLCLVSCIAAVLIFGVFGSRVSQSVQSDPQDVSEQAAQIAEFDLPAGFEASTSMHLLGITFAMYEAPDINSAIVLIQMPIQGQISEANIRQLQEQMERQSGQQLRDLKLIDQYDTTIRGEPGQVFIQEGTNENGVTFRQMMVVFQGQGGLAMLSAFGPSANWDQAAYDQMIKSIR